MRGNRQLLERSGPAGDRLVGAAGVDGFGTDTARRRWGGKGLAPADVPGPHYPERPASATDAGPLQPGLDFASSSPYFRLHFRVSPDFVSPGNGLPRWCFLGHWPTPGEPSGRQRFGRDGLGSGWCRDGEDKPGTGHGQWRRPGGPGLRTRWWAGCNGPAASQRPMLAGAVPRHSRMARAP